MRLFLKISAILVLTGSLISCPEAIDGNPFGDGDFVSVYSSSSNGPSSSSSVRYVSSSSSAAVQYCYSNYCGHYGYYDYDDYWCDRIGGSYAYSVNECIIEMCGTVVSREWCISNEIDIDDN
jgi:hypothetical protein